MCDRLTGHGATSNADVLAKERLVFIKKAKAFYFFIVSQVYAYEWQSSLICPPSSPGWKGRPGGFQRARVQRGESATARWASTGNRQAAFIYPNPLSRKLKGVAEVPFTARIERAHSYRARSASKKGTWPLPPQPSKLVRYLFRDGG